MRGEAPVALLLGLAVVLLLVGLAVWLVGGSGRDAASDTAVGPLGAQGPTQELEAYTAAPPRAADESLVAPAPAAVGALVPAVAPRAWEDAPEGSTRGVVLTVDGEPLAGATVQVFPAYEGCAEATTDEQGRWWLGPATDLRGYGLIASHPEYAPDIQARSFDLVQPVASTATANYEHRLRPLVTVTGSLRWSDGEPFADTGLLVREASPMVVNSLIREPLGRGATDAEGRFTLRLGARQVVRLEPEGGLAEEIPFELLVHEVGEGADETWDVVVPRPVRLRVVVRTDPELHADLDAAALTRARVVVMSTLDAQRLPDVAPLVDGLATFSGLDARLRHLIMVGVPGYEAAVLDWSLALEGELTERVYDLPELVPSAPPSPAQAPEAGFRVNWAVVDEHGEPLDREAAYALLPYYGGPFGRVEAESLTTGETGAALLGQLGSDVPRGQLVLPVAAPARVTVRLGDDVTVFEGVEDGDELQLPAPSGPDRHDVLLCPVDEHGRPLGVWGVVLRDDRGGPQRIVPVLHTLQLPVRLAAGRWHATPRLLGGRAPVTTVFDVPVAGGGERVLLPVPEPGGVRVRLTPWFDDGSYDVTVITADDGASEGAGYGVPVFVAVDGDGTALLRTVAPGRRLITCRRRGPDGVVSVAGRVEVDVRSGRIVDVELPVRPPGAGRVVELCATLSQGPGVRERVRMVTLFGPDGSSHGAVVGLHPSLHRLAHGTWTARWTGRRDGEQASLPAPRERRFTVVPGDGVQRVELDG